MSLKCVRGLVLCFVYLCAAQASQDYYIAAAFQNAIVGDGCPDHAPSGQACDGRSVQRANLAKFDKAMAAATKQGAQIIVFNEGGVDAQMWSHGKWLAAACEEIPEPSPSSIPCAASNWDLFPVTRNASCLARKHGIVTVINTCDRQPCQPGSRSCVSHSDTNCCPVSGFELFNTQLAFSETGQLLAKYHKVHNYDTAPDQGESDTLCCWPPRLDYAHFDTSFGVRFGMHICFDIMYRTPGLAMALNKSLGIRDFVYSTHWETPGPPMLPGTEIQQAWSRAVGVNLIAANAGLGWSHAGSGIYSQGKALAVHYMPTKAHDDHLLVAKVPKLTQAPVMNVVPARPTSRLQAPPVPFPAFRGFEVGASSEGTQIVMTASGSFTCNFTFRLANKSTHSNVDRFLVMAVSGSWMGKDNLPSRSCVVVRCGTLSEAECAVRTTCTDYYCGGDYFSRSLYNNASTLEASTMFEHFSLRGDFEPGDVVLPVVGTSMGELVSSDAISVSGGEMHVTLQKPLLNAMLYAIPDDTHLFRRSRQHDEETIV